MGDGDAMAEVGYCYLYGIGTRRSGPLARRILVKATKSTSITELAREGALYLLAVDAIDNGRRRQARALLARAAVDDDYPEAMELRDQINSGAPVEPCRCRRSINKNLLGHAKCGIHARAVNGR